MPNVAPAVWSTAKDANVWKVSLSAVTVLVSHRFDKLELEAQNAKLRFFVSRADAVVLLYRLYGVGVGQKHPKPEMLKRRVPTLEPLQFFSTVSRNGIRAERNVALFRSHALLDRKKADSRTISSATRGVRADDECRTQSLAKVTKHYIRNNYRIYSITQKGTDLQHAVFANVLVSESEHY